MMKKSFLNIPIALSILLYCVIDGNGSIKFQGDKDHLLIIISDFASNFVTAKSLFLALSNGKLPSYTDDTPVFRSSEKCFDVYCCGKGNEKDGIYSQCLIGMCITDKATIEKDAPISIQIALSPKTSKELYDKLLVKVVEGDGLKVKEFYSKDGNLKIMCYKNANGSKLDVECLVEVTETLK